MGSSSLGSPKSTGHGGLSPKPTFPLVLVVTAVLLICYFLFLRPRIWHGYEAFTLQIEITSWMGPTTIPAFPALPILLAVALAAALSLLPFRNIASSQARGQYGPRLWRAAVNFLWVPVFLAVGSLVFYLTNDYLPKFAQALGGVLSISLHWKLGGFESTQKFGLEGVCGLMVGLYLWKKCGFR